MNTRERLEADIHIEIRIMLESIAAEQLRGGDTNAAQVVARLADSYRTQCRITEILLRRYSIRRREARSA